MTDNVEEELNKNNSIEIKKKENHKKTLTY